MMLKLARHAVTHSRHPTRRRRPAKPIYYPTSYHEETNENVKDIGNYVFWIVFAFGLIVLTACLVHMA